MMLRRIVSVVMLGVGALGLGACSWGSAFVGVSGEASSSPLLMTISVTQGSCAPAYTDFFYVDRSGVAVLQRGTGESDTFQLEREELDALVSVIDSSGASQY